MKHSTPRTALAALALIGSLGTAHAEAKDQNALRALAVGGTLASWAYAAWEGAPFTDCRGARWQVRGNVAHDHELSMASAGAAYGDCQMLSAGGWALSHQTNFSVGRWWTTRSDVSGASTAWDAAVVPLVHWQHHAFANNKFELEFGIGPAWLSEVNIGDRHKGSNFQFSDHLGVNLVDGGGQWRVGLQWRHLSNADIKKPNNGVNFTGVVLSWAL